MGWYGEHVLPRLLDAAMDTEHARRIRARVAAGLSGDVVEVGFGAGHNLPHLPARVTRLLAVEPSRPSVRRADARIATFAIPVELVGLDAGLAPDEDVRRWQSRLNRLQQRFVGGCTLDRDIPALLRSGGMTLTHLDRYYGQGEPKALAAMYEGTAVPD